MRDLEREYAGMWTTWCGGSEGDASVALVAGARGADVDEAEAARQDSKRDLEIQGGGREDESADVETCTCTDASSPNSDDVAQSNGEGEGNDSEEECEQAGSKSVLMGVPSHVKCSGLPVQDGHPLQGDKCSDKNEGARCEE
jgi:hypothetical protein